MTERKYAGHTLAEIKAAAEGMRGWKIEEARRVGEDEICEFGTEHDGEWYPLGTVDGQTYTSNPADDLVIARHFVTANPATVLAMATRIEELEQASLSPATDKLTDAMIDAPRQFLAFYACAHRSVRTAETRRHLDLSGVDYSCWPEWAKVGDISITKAGAAVLIWTLMQAAAGVEQEVEGHD